jgi:hypothetical protein
MKNAIDAEILTVEFLVPVDNECFYSFQTPVISLEYRIVLEFYLAAVLEETSITVNHDEILQADRDSENQTYSEDTSKIPLSFSFPIDVSSTYHGHNSSESKKMTRIQLQSLCLASRKSQMCITDNSES